MSKELRMPNINKVLISCRVTNDPELRYTTNYKAVLRVSVANNRSFKAKDEWQLESSFLNLIYWGERAERLAKQIGKGSPLLAEGALRVHKWESNGKSGINVEVLCDRIHVLEKADEGPF